MQKCAQCNIPAAKALQCGACKSAVYCSRQCQLAAWKGHKTECRTIVARADTAAKSRAAEFSKIEEYVSGAMQATRGHQLFVRELNAHFDAGRLQRVVALRAEAIAVAEALRDDLALDADDDDVAPHVVIANIYATLGMSMRMLGDYHKSLEMCRQAMAAIDRVPSLTHPCKVWFLMKLQIVLTDLRHNEEALSVLRRIEEATLEGPDETRMMALGSLASFFVRTDDFDQAIEYYPRVMKLSVARGNKTDTARFLNEFAYAVMMAGDAPRAYTLYEESSNLATEVSDSEVMGISQVGMARSMWANLQSPEIVDDDRYRGLAAFSKHIYEARRLLEDNSTHQYGAYCHVVMFSAFQEHLIGESDSALIHMSELMFLMSTESRCWCSTCWQKRDDDHRLVMCSRCRVARFCNRECQEKGSKGRDRTNTRHIVPHRYMCKMMREHSLILEAEAAGNTTVDLVRIQRENISTFMRRMTASVLASDAVY